MPRVNLDTNIVIRAVLGKLTDFERRVLDSTEWAISPIVLWELAKLSQLGKLPRMSFSDARLMSLIDDLYVLPITTTVARVSTELDFQSDPADEIIAATSLVYGVPLLTEDRKLLASKIVPLADESLLA